VSRPHIARGYVPGLIGAIAGLHARYYAAHAGFGSYFESKVARELGEFCTRLDPRQDGIWYVTQDDIIFGAIAIDGIDAAGEGAHLRWFILAPHLHGQGYGRALLGAALDFCRACDHRRVYLWTFAGLDAARYLYEAAGFALTRAEAGSQWGREVLEQRFELAFDLARGWERR
jgi:GNAT superfamily N-acetyltransferase